MFIWNTKQKHGYHIAWLPCISLVCPRHIEHCMENRPIISNIAQNIEHNGIKQVWNNEIHQKTGTYEATVHEVPVSYKNEFYAADITYKFET